MNKPVMKKTMLTNKLGYTVLGVFVLVLIMSLTISLTTLNNIKKNQNGGEHFIKYWGSWILNLA